MFVCVRELNPGLPGLVMVGLGGYFLPFQGNSEELVISRVVRAQGSPVATRGDSGHAACTDCNGLRRKKIGRGTE